MSNTNAVIEAVSQASQAWVEAFNKGDARYCANAYTEQTIMDARPMGQFEGREAVFEFWAPFIAQGATDLVYKDINIEVLDDNAAILSANWSMNVGHGFISKELWVRDTDGVWRLKEDDFTVVEQYGS